jgi:hypothetical protein
MPVSVNKNVVLERAVRTHVKEGTHLAAYKRWRAARKCGHVTRAESSVVNNLLDIRIYVDENVMLRAVRFDEGADRLSLLSGPPKEPAL